MPTQPEGLAEDRHPTRYVLHNEKTPERIVGRVLDKGLGGDEMGERVRLVIDGVDGRVHHVELEASRAEEIGRGMIVAAGPAPSSPRAADRNIMDIAGTQGIYRPSAHLERRIPADLPERGQAYDLARDGANIRVSALSPLLAEPLVSQSDALAGDKLMREPKDLIQRLEAADIERAGKALAAERGRQWQPATPGN